MVFEPETSSNSAWIVIGIICLIGGTVGFFVFDKQKKRILQMLSGFLACIALGVSLFSGWANSRIETLVIEEDYFMIGQTQYQYEHLEKMEIVPQSQTPNGKRLGADVLVLGIKNQNEAIVFSNDNYDIKTIFSTFRRHLKEEKK